MKKIFLLIISALLLVVSLTGCGEDPVLTKFKTDVESFCKELATLDASINSIDAQSETAPEELLGYLDQLDQSFKVFAELTPPAEYAYVEGLADEASTYMTTAVASYHEAFGENSYNEYTAEYARENYERAYLRITVILQLLHGEDINIEGVTVEQSVSQ